MVSTLELAAVLLAPNDPSLGDGHFSVSRTIPNVIMRLVVIITPPPVLT
ncbi:hypothetical protein [Mycolicibacterium sp. HS_4_1]